MPEICSSVKFNSCRKFAPESMKSREVQKQGQSGNSKTIQKSKSREQRHEHF